MSEPNQMSASALASAIAEGALSPETVVESCLARISAREDEVGAWVTLDRDQIARELSRIAAIPGSARGPLFGVPVGIKDVYDTADLPTAYGSQIYADHRPAWDAATVARLRAAGAVILGKTITTEFAYWKAGKTRNPHDASRTPGGSSSGSAASVADYMVPLATGTQTVASTMRPAAFCGIVGFKPGFGRISTTGIKTLAGSLDTVGAFARTVPDVALLASVLAGRADWLTDQGGTAPPVMKMARSPDWDAVTPPGIAAIEQTAKTLEAGGATLITGDVPDGFAPLSTIQNTVLAFEAARDFSSEWLDHRSLISPELTGLIEQGLAIPATDYEAALAVRAECAASLDHLFGEADVLLAPSAVGEAPVLSEGTGDPIMSRAWTLLGLPTISLPCGAGPDGLPLGLQIAARPGKDRQLLAAAAWFEAVLGRAASE